MTHQSSIFAAIVANEESLEQLFSSIENIDNEEMIGESWTKYYYQLAPLVLDLADHSKLLFKRYVDEFSKNINTVAEDLTRKQLLQRVIRNSLRSFFDNTMRAKLFSDIANEGIFGYIGSFDNYKRFIVIEDSLAFLQKLFFDNKNIKEALDVISTDLALIEEHHHFDRINHLIQNQSESNDELKVIYGKLRFNDACVSNKTMNQIFGEFDVLSGNDYITRWFINHSPHKNFTQALENWDNTNDQVLLAEVDKLLLITLPLTQARSNYFKAQYFFNASIEIARKGLHKIAHRHLDTVLELCNIIISSLPENALNDEMKNLIDMSHQLKDQTSLLHGLTGMNISYRDLVRCLTDSRLDDASKIIEQMNQTVSQITKGIDIKYISAIPSIFESIASSANLLISMGKPPAELEQAAERLFDGFKNRIEIAVNQIVQNWDAISELTNIESLKLEITNVQNDLRILYQASSLLPAKIDGREDLITRIDLLINLAKSIVFEIRAREIESVNRIEELVFKARAFYFAKKALTLSKETNSKSIPLSRVISHVTGSFVTGHFVQISISQLSSQFIYISEILPKILLAVTQDPLFVEEKDLSLTNLKTTLADTKRFIDNLDRIREDTQQLLEFQEEYSSSNIELQSSQVEFKSVLASILKTFFNSAIQSIIGRWASKLGLQDQALIHFKQAQDLAFEAAKLSEEIKENPEFQQKIGSNVYSFGQFCQTSISKIEKNVEIEFPMDALLSLLRDLVFSL